MPTPIIFDTDIWSDIDDPLALAMLHALEDRAEVRLLAVTVSTNLHWCASYVDLVNTFYGRPDVPIGIVRDGVEMESIIKKLPDWFVPVSRYTQLLSEQRLDDGSWRYPRRLTAERATPDATTLLRKTLAAQPDRSVVVVEVGYHTNLARLLGSPPDTISALNGHQLVARKVRRLVVMAGSFRWPAPGEINGENRFPKQDPEFNLVVDIPAAQMVFASWPTPIVATGVEVGAAMRYPPESILNDYSYVRHYPIAQTYLAFSEERRAKEPLMKVPHAHATFDLTAVLYAARPNRNYFSISAPGRITVLDDGSSHFEEARGGRDRYLVLTDEQKARTLEAMVMLTSQPPLVRHSV